MGADQALAKDLYRLVARLHASCNHDLLEAIAREQLTFSQVALLEQLRAGKRPTLSQAAKMMHVSAGGASRIVDDLARRGLARREQDDDDFRSKRLMITDRGSEAILRLYAPRLEGVTRFTETLSERQASRLHSAIVSALGPQAAVA